MAVDLHNKELLLPSQFFTEEYCDTHTLSVNKQQPINQNWSCFASSDSGSELSSPVESELGSTETESSEEEDDYIAELTRQMTHYMFQDDDTNKQEKVWGLAGSPQSTLWPHLGSNHDSPIGPSREPSPPVTPMIGSFEKMKINDEIPPKIFNNHGERFFTTPIKPTSVRNQNLGFHSNQVLVDDQIRAIQFYRLKQEQILKQQESQYWNRQANVSQKLESKQLLKHFNNKERSCNGFSNGQNVQWPALQQQQHINHQAAGSEMRAVFLNGSGSRTSSCGTGVFLPCGIGNSNESRKKSGCSTVLIPARVAQALKLHFDKMGATSRSNGSSYPLQHDALKRGRSSLHTQQKPKSKTVPAMNHQEMGLPQEWTY